MTTTVTKETAEASARAQAVDAARHVAHLAHEARLVKSLASDAVDEAVHASKKAIKTARRRVQDLADMRYDVEHRVRREPLKAVGMAFGVGMLLGALTSLVFGARRTNRGRD